MFYIESKLIQEYERRNNVSISYKFKYIQIKYILQKYILNYRTFGITSHKEKRIWAAKGNVTRSVDGSDIQWGEGE